MCHTVTLQRVAVCCSVLQCVAVCSSVLQCVVHGSVLQVGFEWRAASALATHYNTLQYTATHNTFVSRSNALQHAALLASPKCARSLFRKRIVQTKTTAQLTASTNTHAHACTHMHARTRMHAHACTRTHTRACAHTHSCACQILGWLRLFWLDALAGVKNA